MTIDASAVVTKAQLDEATAGIDDEIEKIVDGTTPVAKATNADTATNAGHATSADTATNANHATNADEATNATYAQTASTADTAGYATTAKGDENGNDIAATYATKSELAAAGQFDPNGTYPNLTAGKATHAANADAATSAASATEATHATVADSATSATDATNDGLGRNIANTYVLKGEEGWRLNLYACTISFSTTAAIYFCYPYRIFSFDIDDIANDLYSKGMRSITQAFPVAGIEPGGGQVVGMYSKNRSSITLAVITGAQLTEMSLPSGTLDKSSYI